LLITSRSDCTILAANEQFKREFGYAEEDLVGNIPSEVGMWTGVDTEGELQKRLSSEAPVRNEMISVHTADGTLRRVPLALDQTSDDREGCLVWRFPVERGGQNGSSSSDQEEEHDSLTGLATRSSFLHQVGRRLEQAPSEEAEPALLCVTIREYRDVTESFGYGAGQQFLAAVATRIEDVLPPTATTARISEDTFAVLLRAGEDDARELGRTLLKAFDMPFQIADQQVPVEAIAGLAVWSGTRSAFSGAEEMLQASYLAMHRERKSTRPEIYTSTGTRPNGRPAGFVVANGSGPPSSRTSWSCTISLSCISRPEAWSGPRHSFGGPTLSAGSSPPPPSCRSRKKRASSATWIAGSSTGRFNRRMVGPGLRMARSTGSVST